MARPDLPVFIDRNRLQLALEASGMSHREAAAALEAARGPAVSSATIGFISNGRQQSTRKSVRDAMGEVFLGDAVGGSLWLGAETDELALSIGGAVTKGVAGVPEYSGLQITSAGVVLLTNPTDATDIVRLRLLAGLLREHGPMDAKLAKQVAMWVWAGTKSAALTWRPT